MGKKIFHCFIVLEQSCDYSDEEEDESTPNEDGGSDSELMIDDPTSNAGLIPPSARTSSTHHKGFKFPTPASRFTSRQKNLKQKFVALLKKFKMSEEEVKRWYMTPSWEKCTSFCLRP